MSINDRVHNNDNYNHENIRHDYDHDDYNCDNYYSYYLRSGYNCVRNVTMTSTFRKIINQTTTNHHDSVYDYNRLNGIHNRHLHRYNGIAKFDYYCYCDSSNEVKNKASQIMGTQSITQHSISKD